MAAKGVTVATTDFPLYCIRLIGDRHILVAGGGGASKTGIPNAIDIYELKHENRTLTAHKVTRYETETRPVMNCAVVQQDRHFVLAAGLEGSCRLYTLRYKIITPKVENEALEGLRKRKGNLTMSTDHKMASKMIGFDVEHGEEIVTDQSKDGGFQKVVHFNKDLTNLVTAGADGFLRVWKYPSLKSVYEVHAHSNEVDDMDISPDGSKICTVSKDNLAFIWNFTDGSKVKELSWKTENPYRIRNCRFGIVKDKENTYNLYTSHIPVVRGKRPSNCYVVKWETSKYAPIKVLNVGTEILSALAISDDGVYLAAGTISGSVSVFISFSLQRLYHIPEVHRIFVTGLEFAHTTDAARAVTGNYDFTLFSVSADNQVKVHQQESQVGFSLFWAILGFIIFVFLIFWILSALGI